MTERIVIVRAKRTPQGRFLGALASCSAADLGVAAARAALEGLDPAVVDRVIVGNVIGAGQKLNVARQVALRAGVPEDRPAFTVNMACASGMLAVSLAAQAIRAGAARVVLCGGAESMSNAPYVLDRARAGYKLGHGRLIDTLLSDALTDALHDEHMAMTAERLAREYGQDRAAQDAFALQSQQRAAAAMAQGAFDAELVAVNGLERDEHPRASTTLEGLAGLKPAFDASGTVTAGNAAGINDGAAMLLVAHESTARQLGVEPMAAIAGASEVGCDPRRMGLGPVHATRRLCEQLGCEPAAFDMVELNEAFAAQALACLHDLNLSPDAAHVNPHGGSIALGHPVGATGARLLVHLAHLIHAGDSRRALATLCVGGGMGAAVALER